MCVHQISIVMRKVFLYASICLLLACSKKDQNFEQAAENDIESQESSRPPKSNFTKYTIRAGQHYCDQNTLRSISTSEMKFIVRFDNSAIYQSAIPENQYDINKLWGFSEGFNNQFNSARVGWSWNDGALRLYAYVYSNGIRYSQEITSVDIGSDINCSIKVAAGSYIFTVNGISVTMPRAATGTKASGFQQYPYFGGDETAPHLITIYITNL